MRSFMVSPVLLGAGLLLATAVADSQGGGGAQKPAALPLLQDYISFTVTAPPPALELDPFYKKFVDALGIPVVTSAKVPDAALLMARDIVQFMLANRPDLRKELIRKKWKLGALTRSPSLTLRLTRCEASGRARGGTPTGPGGTALQSRLP